ncbi:hypothetical protein IT774_01265 [Salinimonas marina]|uniref:Tetratricopeptide repeat protein n=1 Tax=Salinimonas marina TaxID=2785918 RepID=A0A7S9DYZ0_9ALTE|nr:hypothetical protein [Salinimonas marina]QPG05920.1 hypothetical protein IT774_01265 [Salinimonas marina]
MRPEQSIFIFIMVLLGVSACAAPVTSPEKAPEPLTWQPYYSTHGVPVVPVLNEHDVYVLSETQRETFMRWFEAPAQQHLPPHKRLAAYLENTLYGFSFNGSTHTAQEAAREGEGNCLSLAILTAAYARLAGLEIKFQRVNSPPLYKKYGDLMLISSHVRTKILKPDVKEASASENTLRIARGGVIIDYFSQFDNVTGGYVTADEVTAMFYRNHVAQALIENRYPEAFWLAHKALTLAPTDPENVTAMALTLRRLGRGEEADNLYQRSVEAGVNNITLLSNYEKRLKMVGKYAQADEIEKLILDNEDHNPYAWIALGHERLVAKQPRRAEILFKKALRRAPYLDDIYLGLASSYFLQGKRLLAEQALLQAQELAWDEKSKLRYEKKRSVLESF